MRERYWQGVTRYRLAGWRAFAVIPRRYDRAVIRRAGSGSSGAVDRRVRGSDDRAGVGEVDHVKLDEPVPLVPRAFYAWCRDHGWRPRAPQALTSSRLEVVRSRGMSFTTAEIDYLRSQPLGRLATVGADGVVQANSVGFRIDDGTIVVGGHSLAMGRKYRNVAATGRAALVVDDLVSPNPWTVRGIEIRGRAQATITAEPPIPGTASDIIRIFPESVFTWGVEPGSTGMTRRREVSDNAGPSSASASGDSS